MKIKNYFYNLAVAIDQLFNALFNGYPDETISSRSYRLSKKYWYAKYAMNFIDFLFLWQTQNHCEKAYKNELKRKHFPLSQEELKNEKINN
ncbi:hypothetical protein [Campylobacter sp.]|uniref:hypothetical protein n=1 Tax=Campylobacter sp. TaxID=205 RepID=UPI0025C4DD50|nr:hypothetical protein [Campylobacter sp.]